MKCLVIANRYHRLGWLVACRRKAAAAVRRVFARLEQAFDDFAQVPYRDFRTLRELQQMLDELEDLNGAPGKALLARRDPAGG
jgi:hypothetical protein